eukprot:CFRG0970T1
MTEKLSRQTDTEPTEYSGHVKDYTQTQNLTKLPTETDVLDSTLPAAMPPDKEIYGFVMYCISWLGFGLYLLYAIATEATLHRYGITFPAKWWSLAVPVYICSLWVFLLSIYMAVNLYRTPPLDSLDTIQDEFSMQDAKLYKPNRKKYLPRSNSRPAKYGNHLITDSHDGDMANESDGTGYSITPMGDTNIREVMECLYGPSFRQSTRV